MPYTPQWNLGACVENMSCASGQCVPVDSLSEMTLEQRRHALLTLLSRWQAFKENRRDRSPGDCVTAHFLIVVPDQAPAIVGDFKGNHLLALHPSKH